MTFTRRSCRKAMHSLSSAQFGIDVHGQMQSPPVTLQRARGCSECYNFRASMVVSTVLALVSGATDSRICCLDPPDQIEETRRMRAASKPEAKETMMQRAFTVLAAKQHLTARSVLRALARCGISLSLNIRGINRCYGSPAYS
ncbi:hypothetical protein PENSPDRAFT_289292 [Peniophora sp. CONT]|nr:hypothetical protein PENSPDRAFT_289292 [Peniophora sp. CONT]